MNVKDCLAEIKTSLNFPKDCLQIFFKDRRIYRDRTKESSIHFRPSICDLSRTSGNRDSQSSASNSRPQKPIIMPALPLSCGLDSASTIGFVPRHAHPAFVCLVAYVTGRPAQVRESPGRALCVLPSARIVVVPAVAGRSVDFSVLDGRPGLCGG